MNKRTGDYFFFKIIKLFAIMISIINSDQFLSLKLQYLLISAYILIDFKC